MGAQVSCPTCQRPFRIEAPVAAGGARYLPSNLRLAPAAVSNSMGNDLSSSQPAGTAAYCLQCGRMLPPGHVFCSGCGTQARVAPKTEAVTVSRLPETLVAALPYIGGVALPTVVMSLFVGVLVNAAAHGTPSAAALAASQALSHYWWVIGTSGVTALVCYLLDRRSFVRWHAMQALAFFVGGGCLRLLLGVVLGRLLPRMVTVNAQGIPDLGVVEFFASAVQLAQVAGLILVVVALISALMRRRFRIPIAASCADVWSGEE